MMFAVLVFAWTFSLYVWFDQQEYVNPFLKDEDDTND